MNQLSREGINRASAAFLIGVGVVQVVSAMRTSRVEENAIGAAVCLIAFLHYSWMENANDIKMLELRYSDWIVTCPLLLWELHKMTGQTNKSTLALPILLVVIMLAFGFISNSATDRSVRNSFFVGGCVAFLLCIALFLPNVRSNHALVYAFFGVWALYPVASWFDSNVMLSLLDMISKGCFGLYIATESMKTLKD